MGCYAVPVEMASEVKVAKSGRDINGGRGEVAP